MKNLSAPIMFSQITSRVDLRAFAIQIAQSYAEDIDGLIEKARRVEHYVEGYAILPETPRDPNIMYEELCKLMTSNSKKEEEKTANTQENAEPQAEQHE